MDLYYLNSKGDKIELNGDQYIFSDGNLFDYEWSHTDFEGLNKNRIKRIYKSVTTRNCKIGIRPNLSLNYDERIRNFESLVERLYEVIEYDVINNTLGKFYAGEEYIECMLIASSKSEWRKATPFLYNEMTVLIPNPIWITEKKLEFKPITNMASTSQYLEYSYDYRYEYFQKDVGAKSITLDHFTDSDFKMIIYGPCVDPRILINESPYQVLTTLESNEYIVVDSKENTIVKHLANGVKKNVFDLRLKTSSIFKKISYGSVSFNWDGTFGFDITIYLERSQPTWSF